MRSHITTALVIALSFHAARAAVAQTCAFSFGPSVPHQLGFAHDRALAVGDFNGDGADDAVVGSGNVPGIAVLLAAGDGSFLAASPYVMSASPNRIITADLNLDGNLDLVALFQNSPASFVIALRGAGDGSFTAFSGFAAASDTRTIAAGEFTGDAHIDIVTATTDGLMTVFAGNGAGQFGAGVHRNLFGIVADLVSGDFNGDGRADLAAGMNFHNITTGNNGVVGILLGSAAGLEAPKLQPIGREMVPIEIAAADYNGDGDLDLVLGFPDAGLASLLFGDGTGGLAPGPIVTAGLQALTDVVAADLNSDGFMDVAVTDVRATTFPNEVVTNAAMVDVHFGDGSGSFQAHGTFMAGLRLLSMGAGDVDGNGHTDLVAIDSNDFNHNDRRAVALVNTCGVVTDVSVTIADSVDPVQPNNGHTELIVDVTSHGPNAGPVLVRIALDELRIDEGGLTTTQGQCTILYDGHLGLCWLGILGGDSPSSARIVVSALSGCCSATSVVQVISGGIDADLTDNISGVTTRVAPVGGKDLRLRYGNDGSVLLTWRAGDFQAGYFIGRYVGGVKTILPGSGALPVDATSFSDPSPVPGEINCYVVVPVDATGAQVGSSDMLCVKPGSASGTAPPSVSIELRQGVSPILRWDAPGGQTGYLLIIQRLDGQPQQQVALNGSTTAYRDNTNWTPTCYVLIPGNGTTPLGQSDVFCAIPGHADFDITK